MIAIWRFYREGIYGLMAGQKYRGRICQTVLLHRAGSYMRMDDRLDLSAKSRWRIA